MSWTNTDVSELETQLVAGLHLLQSYLRQAVRPQFCLPLIAVGVNRGLSLRNVMELVQAAHRSIDVVLAETYPTGWRGSWRRFRSRSTPAAQRLREITLAVVLRDAVRVMKALRLEEYLSLDVMKLAELADTPRDSWPEILSEHEE